MYRRIRDATKLFSFTSFLNNWFYFQCKVVCSESEYSLKTVEVSPVNERARRARFGRIGKTRDDVLGGNLALSRHFLFSIRRYHSFLTNKIETQSESVVLIINTLVLRAPNLSTFQKVKIRCSLRKSKDVSYDWNKGFRFHAST